MLFDLRSLVPVLSCILLAGCGNFVRLADDVREIRSELRIISGRIFSADCPSCPIVMTVIGGNDGLHVQNFRVLERSGDFRVTGKGNSKWLFLFQDINKDSVYQDTEKSRLLEIDSILIKNGNIDVGLLNIDTQFEGDLPVRFSSLFSLRGNGLDKIDIQLGEVVEISDVRFDEDSAEMGVWEPLGFMKTKRAGIFFLEDFDQSKTPVLLVHGINGSPRNFKKFIDKIDRNKYQVWVLNYPSGLDLKALGDALMGLLAELNHRYSFKQLHIISHSMGGLLVRELLSVCAQGKSCHYINHVVSISAPFGGIPFLGEWINNSRITVPVWKNLYSDGEFISGLFKHRIPENIESTLIFGFMNSSTLDRESGDGVIPLRSQLAMEAQLEAQLVRGFNEDHESILLNEAMIDLILQRISD